MVVSLVVVDCTCWNLDTSATGETILPQAKLFFHLETTDETDPGSNPSWVLLAQHRKGAADVPQISTLGKRMSCHSWIPKVKGFKPCKYI